MIARSAKTLIASILMGLTWTSPAQAQTRDGDRLIESGQAGRTGICKSDAPIWQVLGWKRMDAIPLRYELLREPGLSDYASIVQDLQSVMIACSTSIEQEQVNRDPDRNVWRPEVYVTAKGFGALGPNGVPAEIGFTFQSDRKDRKTFYLDRVRFEGDLAQGQVWLQALQQEWGPAPDTRYDPPGTRVFGNIYGDVYNSTPTDEIRVWGWLASGTSRRGREYSNYQTTLTCNISRKACNLIMQTGGTIPHWSPRYRPPNRR